MFLFGFNSGTLACMGALKNLCHLVETAFLGERERRIAGAIREVDVGTRIDERLERGGVALTAITQHNRFDQRGPSEIVE